MTVNKRRKNSRLRGSHTHGWGSKKKHRGAGHRGGRGNAGSGKRADSKKPSIWKNRYFGKKGFNSKRYDIVHSINLMNIEQSLEKWLGKKLISKDGEFYDIDLGKIGYQKVLSRGKVNTKLKIKTLYASKSAIDKVKKAGGEVNTLGNVKEEISKDE
tara:strand:- start:7502 stop:7972 length:471 start_codon:yes stop_codon:yes gene_type:complete